jgi:isopentenyl phosphate kinase
LKKILKILKLGGSVITYKNQYFSPHMENIKRLTIEIAKSRVKSMIIVHGAGSFGHPIAKKYLISEGLKDKDQLIGFSKTHQAMIQLNQIIVDNLLMAKIPAFGVCTSSILISKGTRLVRIDLSVIKRLLEIGLIPVMYGDAVLDTEQGLAIVSGDQLVVKLAIEFKADQIIFGSDVDGIFTSNPKIDSSAKFLEKISIRGMTADIGDTTFTDVTGGMKGKLFEAKEAVRAGTNVIFLNATAKDRVEMALKGEKVMGTILTL